MQKKRKDIWNAFMLKGAHFSKNDIPLCPTDVIEIPDSIINWIEAKKIYRNFTKRGKRDFHNPSYVCFYLNDDLFDGKKGIWNNSTYALKVLKHFAGVITPDFSTYQDFPEPLKIYNTYRMRAFGYWLGRNGLNIINNVRWGTEDSWKYCWDGIPKYSIVSIGTVGGSPRKLADRERFVNGLYQMVEVLRPRTIIVYGSANYLCFKLLSEKGVEIIAYKSHTAKAFEGRAHE